MSHPILDAAAAVRGRTEVGVRRQPDLHVHRRQGDRAARAGARGVPARRASDAGAGRRRRCRRGQRRRATRPSWLAASDPHPPRGRPRRPRTSAPALDRRWAVLAHAPARRRGDARARREVIARALAALARDIDRRGPSARAEETLVGARRRLRAPSARAARATDPRRRRPRRRRRGRGPSALAAARGRRTPTDPADPAPARRRHHPRSAASSPTRWPTGSRPISRPSPTPRKEPAAGRRPVARLHLSAPPRRGLLPAPRGRRPRRRLPLHGGDATTVVVTISLADLRADLATADLLGAGARARRADDTGASSPPPEARRLACTATIRPRPSSAAGPRSSTSAAGQRLFSAAQRKALLLRDRECRAEGCDIPGTWCEAHHWLPWSSRRSAPIWTGRRAALPPPSPARPRPPVPAPIGLPQRRRPVLQADLGRPVIAPHGTPTPPARSGTHPTAATP